ncbi:MAG: YdcF family protein [Pirellulaceae bacterium]|nr:YdcF family protein [Pirellulaceae bacterium]
MTTTTASVVETPRTAPWWPTLIIAALLAVSLASYGYFTHGKPLAEKTLTSLAMPVGALWLLISARLIQLVTRGPRTGMWGLIGLWLLISLLGTRPLPRLLTRWVESRVASYDPARDGGLDVVVVLGGGTSQGTWRPQASGVGDRLVMAAELYHQGLAKQLITTGQVTEGVSDLAPDPSDQTVEIWTKLAIPRTAIEQLGGRNTYEEMQQLKQIWPRLDGKKVGLLTSALHLPRAVRLAQAQGLKLIPIAADVRTAVDDWGLLNFIPGAGNFCELSSTQHEIMAGFVSR